LGLLRSFKRFFFVTGINEVIPDRTILGFLSGWA